MLSMEKIYQLVICYGDYDSYTERTVYADADLEAVRAIRGELKRRATEIALINMRDGSYCLDDIYGWVAYKMEDEVRVRIDAVPLGGTANLLAVEHVEAEDWYMEMFDNMSDQPWQPADEVSRFEELAAPFEKKFG